LKENASITQTHTGIRVAAADQEILTSVSLVTEWLQQRYCCTLVAADLLYSLDIFEPRRLPADINGRRKFTPSLHLNSICDLLNAQTNSCRSVFKPRFHVEP
jgi:hypothetical protein